MKKKSVYVLCATVVAIGLILVYGINRTHTSEHVNANVTKVEKSKSKALKTKPKVMRTPINWHKSSEIIPYPEVKKYPDMWIHVSLEKQRMYLMTQHKVLYTMYITTGIHDKAHETPRGTYHVQAERGKYFYSESENEGAYYWVSWLNHGEFLFHSTPVDSQQHYIKSIAENLGKKPTSHGCIHLSIADSKWVYDNIPYGMKVVID